MCLARFEMRILLGVPGGIAAYKALEFARLAVKAGHSVRVIQTPASLRFVGRASFAAITGAPVLASEFEDDPLKGSWPGEEAGVHSPITHLALIERADVYVVAPATANTLARLASGSAEDLVTTSALAAQCKVILAPAMNGLMWGNEATQANVKTLRAREFEVLDPGAGQLASHGEEGTGRLVEPHEILSAAEAGAAGVEKALDGLRVLVTAGGTREPIDRVRYIGNRSSGKMGVEIARAAKQAGADVTLLAANVAIEIPSGVTLIRVETAQELENAASVAFGPCDVLVMTAAVADFRPVGVPSGKIDKSQGTPSLELEPVNDILRGLAAERGAGQTLVGFAAEFGNGVDRAEEKRVSKGIDLMVYNDISNSEIGFDSELNEVTLLTATGRTAVERQTKRAVAGRIVQAIAELRET